MITSFSRLFRQIFGGPRTQPVTEAAAQVIGADAEAQEAADHREKLKRAMETAFATPTAAVEEPLELAPSLEEQVAAIEAAVTAPEPAPAEEPIEAAAETAPEVEEPAVVETVATAEPLGEWHTVQITDPPVHDIIPALELAEVEEVEPEVALAEEPEPVAEVAEQIEQAQPTIAPEPVVAEIAVVAEEFDEPAMQVIDDQPAAAAMAAGVEDASVETETVEGTVEESAPIGEPDTVADEEIAAAASKAKRTKKAAAKPKPKKKASPAKRKTTKKAATLEDGVWLSDAVAYSLAGQWSTVWTPPEDGSAAERLEVFREKAAAGEFVVWGCTEGSDTWEPIKPAYWKTGLVEPLSFLMGRENVVTDPGSSKAKKPVKYTALKVVGPDIEALWPPSTEGTVRNAA